MPDFIERLSAATSFPLISEPEKWAPHAICLIFLFPPLSTASEASRAPCYVAVPVGSLVSHPDLGHLLTRSQRSATLRLKQLHPSREFPLRAAIIIADRHAKKLKWICSAQAVTFQQTAVIFRSLCLVRWWWSVVLVFPSFLLGGIMTFSVREKFIISACVWVKTRCYLKNAFLICQFSHRLCSF